MEKGISPRRYSDLEKQELIEQWKQSGKSKAGFCKERMVSYYSFNDWLRVRNRKKSTQPSFVPLEIKASNESNFATLTLKNRFVVILHERVEPAYLLALLKA
jgi:transposase-like protein